MNSKLKGILSKLASMKGDFILKTIKVNDLFQGTHTYKEGLDKGYQQGVRDTLKVLKSYSKN